MQAETENIVFPNAPITEAVFDIRVQLPEEVTLEDVDLLYPKIQERFPEKTPRVLSEVGVQLSPANPPGIQTSQKTDGYLYRSQINKKVVQSRLDGFTFNKLKPYEEWKLFSAEAQELWNLYREIVRPIKVVRIALRYINRIEIPLPINSFKEYILTTPEIAPNLPQGLSQFFMRLFIPNSEIDAVAVITQTMDEPKDGYLPYIFDIDVSKEQPYDVTGPEMWSDFEKLRTFKNKIFLESMTDKAKEMFK